MIRVFALLMALLLAFPAAAHQQKITISTVSHNPRTEMLEVVHRVPLHDAEHALKAQGIRAPDIVNDIASRRAFANYITRHFVIRNKGEAMELTLLGTEIEGGNLLVYQEANSPGPGSELLIHAQILSELWRRQENRVNMGTGTSVETLIFQAGDGPKSGILP